MPDAEVCTEFQFPLTSSISYAAGGEQREAQFLTLHAPTSKHVKFCAPLKQAFMRAIGEQSENATEEEKAAAAAQRTQGVEFSPEEVMNFLGTSTVVDYEAVLQGAVQLFTTKGICKVEGEVHLTRALVEQMSMDDLETLTGAYLANFTLRSVLAKLSAS